MTQNTRIRLIAIAVLSFACFVGAARADDIDALPTVQDVNLARYAGRWYEISRLPMWFERNCIGNITATYTQRADGRVDVLNRCKTQSALISAQGIAEVPDPARPGELRVRFAPDWLAWIPVVWGDYWIIDLDSQYQLAAVSDPRREYLWVLSRTPQIDKKTYDALLQRLQNQQFDTRKLELTQQLTSPSKN